MMQFIYGVIQQKRVPQLNWETAVMFFIGWNNANLNKENLHHDINK